MTTMLSLILAFMLSIGGGPAASISPGATVSPVNAGNGPSLNLIINEKPHLGEISKIRLFDLMLTAQKARMISLFRINFEKSLLVGYNNYRNRYYMPRIGRFLQTDPMGFEDSMNLYQAFGMNPINFNDPFGKDVLGRCSSSYQHFLNPSENEEIIKNQFRSYALVAEGIANAAAKTFLILAKYITLPARLVFGFGCKQGQARFQ
jgi:RHS repeat-associated protein